MIVFFRADASVTIGTGHVMRCLTLAETLRSRGADVHFICREFEGHLCDVIEAQRGFHVHRLPIAETTNRRSREEGNHAAWLGADLLADAQQTAEILRHYRPDWLIVDHYAIDERWEAELRPLTERIMVIDDLADRRHDCDLLLDQNFSADTERYNALVPETCQKLLGPKYALLREEFREARATLPTRTGSVERIFVFFGGVDLSNETAKALRAIQKAAPDAAVDVVIGAANPHRAELEQLLTGMPKARLHVQVSNMATLMANADLAIGAGGSTTWERCCLGLPSLVVTVAKNQVDATEQLAENGFLIYLGNSDAVSARTLSRSLYLMHNRALRQSLSNQSSSLVDGEGSRRVARALQTTLAVELREAKNFDCELTYRWRNAPEIRTHALDSSPITFEHHRRWFFNVLSDPNRHLLIGERDSEPIGTLRYDLNRETSEAEVSIYVAPQSLGQGLGSALLKAGEVWLSTKERDIKLIKALIKPQNQASLGLFTRQQYDLEYMTFVKHIAKTREEFHAS